MNENIKKTDQGFEVEYTDRENLEMSFGQHEDLSKIKVGTLEEQIEKIRERNVPEVADQLVREVLYSSSSFDGAKKTQNSTDSYQSLEEIQRDIEEISGMANPDALSLDMIAWKIETTVKSGAYLQVNGTV